MASSPTATTDREERVLILAPVGRDAELLRDRLAGSGLAADVLADIDTMCREIENGAGVLLLTQEALTAPGIEGLLATLDAQSPWSDLPLVVLVSRDAPVSVFLGEALGQRANATFLERLSGSATLVRAVEMSLRARRRQYELRDYLRALAAAQASEREARELAEQAVESRDEFLTLVAHDLKNPLGAIRGFVQLLQRLSRRTNALDPQRLADSLAKIEHAANRAITQIDDLLDLSRLKMGQPLTLNLEPVDLVALVQRVVDEAQETSPHHRIHVERPIDGLSGKWDARRLERALANLVGNAVKYSPDGGEVWVSITREADDAVIAVQDQGRGIPASDLPHVFEHFYRGSNAQDLAGTGLGLNAVRQIVEQHGGTISIESDEGLGTRVTVRLPMVQTIPEESGQP